MSTIRSIKLNRYMTANGIFTAASSIIILSFHVKLKNLYQLDSSSLLLVLSAFLSLYAIDLFLTVRKKEINLKKAYYFILSDFLWVIGSLLITFLFKFSWAGILIIAIVAVIVGTFGFLQLKAVHKHGKSL